MKKFIGSITTLCIMALLSPASLAQEVKEVVDFSEVKKDVFDPFSRTGKAARKAKLKAAKKVEVKSAGGQELKVSMVVKSPGGKSFIVTGGNIKREGDYIDTNRIVKIQGNTIKITNGFAEFNVAVIQKPKGTFKFERYFDDDE